MSTVRTCSPAFHFCHQASFCSDTSLDASVAIAKASPGKSGGSSWPVGVLDSGSQAEVRGRWVSSTWEVRRKFVAGGCPRLAPLGKSGGSSWPVGVLDLPHSGSQAEVRGRWVSSTREVRRKFVAGGCPRPTHSTDPRSTCPPPSNGPFTKSVGACPEFRISRGKNGRGCSDCEQPLRQIWLACSRNSGRELRRSLPGSAVPADLNDFVVAATVPTRHQRRPATLAQEPRLMRPRC